VGAGCGTGAALYSLKSFDYIIDIHTLCQSSDSLEIAGAAALNLNIYKSIVLYFHSELLAAYSLGCVNIYHFVSSLSLYKNHFFTDNNDITGRYNLSIGY